MSGFKRIHFLQKFRLLIYGSILYAPILTPSHATSPAYADYLVSGIMSYTTWDLNVPQINFCIVDGPAEFISSEIFNPPSPLVQPNNIKTIYLKTNSIQDIKDEPIWLREHQCNVLYFVNTSDEVQQRLIHYSLNKVLTISENNPECAIGSAFCLFRKNQKFAFQVNLVSLKNSRIRVNSKVLMLSESGGNAP